jgi:hypothetical protein
MRNIMSKLLLSSAILATSLLSPITHAAPATDEAKLKIFNEACVGSWMKNATSDDKANLQKFGEHFCGCAGKNMLAAMNKENITPDEMKTAQRTASETCLAEAILQHTANSVDPKDAEKDKVKSACVNTWGFVFPKDMNDSQKKVAESYCHCAATPLTALTKEKGTLAAADFDTKLSHIALHCRKDLEQKNSTAAPASTKTDASENTTAPKTETPAAKTDATTTTTAPANNYTVSYIFSREQHRSREIFPICTIINLDGHLYANTKMEMCKSNEVLGLHDRRPVFFFVFNYSFSL